MGFWRGETLLEKLPGLIAPFRKENVDCAAYTLTIGREVYVSPTAEIEDPSKVTTRRLNDGDWFTIPPGQFAFLLTEEIVTVPRDALAFISIKAKIKFKGLVNVSGFHVDPGFTGQLIFSVFNAGPVTIHLEQGQPCFLIWYADLDDSSDMVKMDSARKGLDPVLVTGVSGELHSFESLLKKIKDVSDRVNSVEREHAYIRWGVFIVLAIFVGFAVSWFREGAISVQACCHRRAQSPPHPRLRALRHRHPPALRCPRLQAAPFPQRRPAPLDRTLTRQSDEHARWGTCDSLHALEISRLRGRELRIVK
jgi:dCTP deaminase